VCVGGCARVCARALLWPETKPFIYNLSADLRELLGSEFCYAKLLNKHWLMFNSLFFNQLGLLVIVINSSNNQPILDLES